MFHAWLDWATIITAAMAVVGVVVAAVLGFWGVRIAGRGVERAAKDAVASRAVDCATASAQVHRAFSKYLGALHPYWKGTHFTGIESEQFAIFLQESRVHEQKHLLDAELANLDWLLASLEFVFPDKKAKPGGETWRRRVERARARAALVGGAAMPMYSVLITDFGYRSADPKNWFRANVLSKAQEKGPAAEILDNWSSTRSEMDLGEPAVAATFLFEDMMAALQNDIASLTHEVLHSAMPAIHPSRAVPVA